MHYYLVTFIDDFSRNLLPLKLPSCKQSRRSFKRQWSRISRLLTWNMIVICIMFYADLTNIDISNNWLEWRELSGVKLIDVLCVVSRICKWCSLSGDKAKTSERLFTQLHVIQPFIDETWGGGGGTIIFVTRWDFFTSKQLSPGSNTFSLWLLTEIINNISFR